MQRASAISRSPIRRESMQSFRFALITTGNVEFVTIGDDPLSFPDGPVLSLYERQE